MNKQKKIRKQRRLIFVVFNLEIGGAEWVITNLCNEFVITGVEVTLLTNKKATLINNLRDEVNIIYTETTTFLSSFKAIYNHLRYNHYNIVMTTQRTISFLTSIAHLFAFSKSTLVIREAATNYSEMFKQSNLIKRNLLKFLYKWAYLRANILIANSQGTLNSLERNKLIGKKSRVVLLNNPLNIDLILEKAQEKCIIQKIANEKIIVSIGRLVEQKRMHDVIFATKKLLSRGIAVKTYILGGGHLRNDLQKIINEENLENNIFLLGKLKNPYPILNAADVFVLASSFEGFGMVIVESLALGIPVVVTDIPDGPQSILENGKFGYLFPVGDIENFVEGIVKQLKNPPQPELLKNRALKYDKREMSQRFLAEFGF